MIEAALKGKSAAVYSDPRGLRPMLGIPRSTLGIENPVAENQQESFQVCSGNLRVKLPKKRYFSDRQVELLQERSISRVLAPGSS